MRARPTLALTTAVLVGVALAGCSGPDAEPQGTEAPADASADAPGEQEAPAAEGDFCAAYEEAGGTLATPRLFQVAMPGPQTVADLSARVEVLDAVTPPADVATEWQTVRDLFAEALTIAEATPEGGVVADPRVFEIVEELDAPGTVVGDYLDAEC